MVKITEQDVIDIRNHIGWLMQDTIDYMRVSDSKLTAMEERRGVYREGYIYQPIEDMLKERLAVIRSELGVKFNPDQPRVPAGSPDGGQWTSGGSGGNSQYPDAIEPVYPVETVMGILSGSTAIRAAIAAGEESEEIINWTFGSHKSPQKWQNQMNSRGWTEDSINETISKGEKFPAINIIDGKNTPATKYINPDTGKFVVIDDETGELIQISRDDFIE